MTVTIETVQQIDARSVRVLWSSGLGDPTFYVWLDGVYAYKTALTQGVFTMAAGAAVIIDVFDAAAAEPAAAYPGRLLLGWWPSPDVDYYRIDEYYNSAWLERVRVQDHGEGFFTWRTRFLADVTSHQFRIVPVGIDGNEGGAINLTSLMVRHPDPPDVAYAYDSGTTKVTISET